MLISRKPVKLNARNRVIYRCERCVFIYKNLPVSDTLLWQLFADHTIQKAEEGAFPRFDNLLLYMLL